MRLHKIVTLRFTREKKSAVIGNLLTKRCLLYTDLTNTLSTRDFKKPKNVKERSLNYFGISLNLALATFFHLQTGRERDKLVMNIV